MNHGISGDTRNTGMIDESKLNNPWLPISTAPKDGSWFLIIEKESYMAYGPYELAYWDNEDQNFKITDVSEEADFDWWMPLLPPPNTEESPAKQNVDLHALLKKYMKDVDESEGTCFVDTDNRGDYYTQEEWEVLAKIKSDLNLD